MRELKRVLVVILWFAILPASAYAQTTLAGVVKDPSGGVLPGVTVEVSSPGLIEKTRAAVTDSTGQYRLADLPPGTYAVTFTLTGFATVKREVVDVTGAGVVSLNADMRVGNVSETITVTGETPVVDVQSTRRQEVITNAVVSALPASRGYGNILATVPGIQATGLDSGSNPVMNFFTAHGGRGNEGTIQIDGMNVGSAFNGGGVAGFGYDLANAQEIQVTVVGGFGETDRGGPAFNMIPKTGGNKFSGTGFASVAGRWAQGSNLDNTLRGYGITDVPGLIKNWDTNFALGGPVVRDRLWFFGNIRSFGDQSQVPGLFANKNAGDPTQWGYVADPGVSVRGANSKQIEEIRLTDQLTPRNKVGFYLDYQKNCSGSSYVQGGKQCRDRGSDWTAVGSLGGFGSSAPEAGNVWDDREKIMQATWSSAATSRLLLEAGFSTFISTWGGQVPAGGLTNFIPVTEINTGAGVPVPFFTYRGLSNLASNDQAHNVWRASASYVTGAHNMKFGYQAAYQVIHLYNTPGDQQLEYTFFSPTPTLHFPVSFTMRTPLAQSNRTRFDALYVQDQWTRGRLTLQGALRYEHADSWGPAGENGVLTASRFNATPLVFPRTDGVTGYNDITPRMGLAYDVRGNGKTAVKINFSKYLQAANNEANYTIGNPSFSFQNNTARSWTDGNGNFVPDCNLMNPAAQDNLATGGDYCGPWGNSNFNAVDNTTKVNPAVLHGWGVRPYDWQFSASIQQEILPRVSVEVGYNRRSWGNFFVTDNRALQPQDYDLVTITAPQSPLLAGGGGYPVSFYTVKDAKFGQVDNYYTFASDYGNTTYYWHGVDTNIRARTKNGLVFQGGTTTGHGVRDICALTSKLHNLLLPDLASALQVSSCAVNETWQTNFRGLVSYVIPKVDVQISGVIRSQANAQPGFTTDQVATNGGSLAANYNVTSAQIQQAIGRPLAGGNQFQAVDLNLPGQAYGPRINVLDVRFGKILRFGRARTTVGIDLYNIFNSNTGTSFSEDFGTDGSTYLRPTTILNPRFARFNVTVDF
jgi:hypothetical protein